MLDLFEGLNEAQKDAVAAVRGPVCILAGAGTGKTTTITRRIAHQVRSGAFTPRQILAVTFTDKAAKEMVHRLDGLGVSSVRARTFHAAALGMYKSLLEGKGEIVSSKARILVPLIRGLPQEYRKVPVGDFAQEIEWAKNRRITAKSYVESLDNHRGPIPRELMQDVFVQYEKVKRKRGQIDFEDVLGYTARMFKANPLALQRFQDQYRAFTVDEYQDANLLQQELLDVWVGKRDDLCVVGDDYQSIFGFTGATPSYLIAFPARFPAAHIVRLVVNYRSSPQILEVANRLAVRLGGHRKQLQASRPDGDTPPVMAFSDGAEEIEWMVKRIGQELAGGTRAEEIAVLFRINARSEELEEALSKAHIPYQVKDRAFLRRSAAKAFLSALTRVSVGKLREAVSGILAELGYRPGEVQEAEGEEATRQSDLARLDELAAEYGPEGTTSGFVADLESRFSREEDGRGVQILSYHRAKGQEFEVVFLPRLEDRELPFVLAKNKAAFEEERRLFYVGITRAKRRLLLSWARSRIQWQKSIRTESSPFIAELDRRPAATVPRPSPTVRKAPVVSRPRQPSARPAQLGRPTTPRPARSRAVLRVELGPKEPPHYQTLLDRLKAWRSGAQGNAKSAFDDVTLERIAIAQPRSVAALSGIPGVTAANAQRFGASIVSLIVMAQRRSPRLR